MRPKKPIRSWTSFGIGQLAVVANLSRFGLMPSVPTIAPAKSTSVTNSFVFVGDSERPRSWQ